MTNTEEIIKPKNYNMLRTIIALLVLAILLVVSYKLKDVLSPEVAAVAPLDESCDLRKGECTSQLPDGGSITFSMAPNDIPILKPLKLDVQLEGVEVSNVQVDFVGIGMEMGYNRVALDAISDTGLDADSQENKLFAGKAILPVCVRTKMDWEARVLLQTEKGIVMAPFRFYTLK